MAIEDYFDPYGEPDDLEYERYRSRNMKLTIKNARLAFAQGIWSPQQVQGQGDAKFSCTLLLPPNHPQIKEIEAAALAVATEEWGKDAPAIIKAQRAKGTWVLRDGNLKPEYSGFPGALYMSAKNKVRPSIVDRDGVTVLVEADGRPYSGAYVFAKVELYAHEHKVGGKQVLVSLRGVQFFKDGDAFSGGTAADVSEYENLDVSEEAEDPMG